MAKRKQFGICALCLPTQDKELRRSHFLGRAIHALNGKEQVLMTPQTIALTQRQLWRHLLCGDCEQRINRYGETPILRLVQREKDFALLDKLNVALPFQTAPNLEAYSGSAMGIDTEPLAYFALSVLWRSGVRQWTTLGHQTTGVSLRAFEEPIRSYLLGETPLPASIVVNVRVCTDFGSRFHTFAPCVTRGAAFDTYSLLVRGLKFHIMAGDNLPAYFSEYCCVNSTRKVIFKSNCERELLQAAGHIRATAKVSPALSQPLRQSAAAG